MMQTHRSVSVKRRKNNDICHSLCFMTYTSCSFFRSCLHSESPKEKRGRQEKWDDNDSHWGWRDGGKKARERKQKEEMAASCTRYLKTLVGERWKVGTFFQGGDQRLFVADFGEQFLPSFNERSGAAVVLRGGRMNQSESRRRHEACMKERTIE